MPYANNKGADQPMHPRSVISTFIAHSLSSMVPVVAKTEFQDCSSLCSLAGRFESCLITNPEDRFSRDETQRIIVFVGKCIAFEV